MQYRMSIKDSETLYRKDESENQDRMVVFRSSDPKALSMDTILYWDRDID